MKEITNKTKLIALAVIVVVAIIVIVVVTKKTGDTSKDELSEFEQLTLDEPSLNEESAIQLFFFNYFLM